LDIPLAIADGNEFAEFLAQLRLEIARPLGSPARVPTLPRAKLMLAGRSFVADRVGLFVLSHYATPLFLGLRSEHARGAKMDFASVRRAVLLDGPEGQ
jgi:hypothetical protein